MTRLPFLFNTNPLGCPDCGHPSVVRVSSLLGSSDTTSAVVSPQVVTDVLAAYRAAWSPDGVECSSCAKRKKSPLFWLLLHAEAATGPWCEGCLRTSVRDLEGAKGLGQDALVLSVPASKDAYRIAGNTKVKTTSSSSEEVVDAVLF
jgi:hypothetical protein